MRVRKLTYTSVCPGTNPRRVSLLEAPDLSNLPNHRHDEEPIEADASPSLGAEGRGDPAFRSGPFGAFSWREPRMIFFPFSNHQIEEEEDKKQNKTRKAGERDREIEKKD